MTRKRMVTRGGKIAPQARFVRGMPLDYQLAAKQWNSLSSAERKYAWLAESGSKRDRVRGRELAAQARLTTVQADRSVRLLRKLRGYTMLKPSKPIGLDTPMSKGELSDLDKFQKLHG